MTEYEQTGCDKVAFTGNEEEPKSTMDLLIKRRGKPYLIEQTDE